MFEDTENPRVYGLPPGADFPARLVDGLLGRTSGTQPEALARVTILVNTRRMQRRIKYLFSIGKPRLLPRIGLVTDLDALVPDADLPPSLPQLRRKLEISALVGKLLEAEPEIAPRSAVVALTESLLALIDEMQGEGVAPEALLDLDTGDLTGHWERSLKFLSIVRSYTTAAGREFLDPEARRLRAAELLQDSWDTRPPQDPIIVAGSTGSRGITAQVMRAVARLPQGAVILPGFDFEMPEPVFLSLTDQANASKGVEDHPQYRFAKFLTALELSPKQVPCWHGVDNRKSRNQLISLSLRPAPVTGQWLSEGPKLGDLSERTSGLTLVEAPDPKSESVAIAIALRQAIDLNQTAALITPDRTLGRRVAAALQRWDVVPDDSAGRPLALTAPGRFLRLVANLAGKPADPIDLIAALKHPLAASGQNDRGPHLRLTRELELYLRKSGSVTVLPEIIASFSKTRSEGETAWCLWLASWLNTVASPMGSTFGAHLAHHINAAEALASGGTDGAGELWEQTAGRDVLKLIAQFQAEADYPGPLPFADYLALIERALASENTRDHDEARPDVMIWGTLEARVQGADLVILGGLNEGVWPEEPGPDPWLNRKLRRDLGLLLPERQIGLSAHDYQQAVAAKSVVLSRSRRSADSETVPSRWLSRLTNLIEGLEQQSGSSVLASMRARGDAFLQQAAILDTPARPHAPENRPAPAPPVSVRPKRYSVTEIERLIRDPYAIYARRILHLERLDVLSPVPDALTKGSVFHAIFEEAFSVDADFSDTASSAERLRLIARRHLDQLPWPGVSAHWFGHLDSIADHLVIEEQGRRLSGKPLALERKGQIDLPGTPFSIKGKADRIDRLPDGTLIIYDYKTGKPPSAHQIRHFDRQLPIEALMAQLGGFEDLQAAPVSHIGHIGLGRTPETNVLALENSGTIDLGIGSIRAELAKLLASYDTASKGYPSRRAMEKMRFDGDYDHLARFGEWDETCDPQVVDLP